MARTDGPLDELFRRAKMYVCMHSVMYECMFVSIMNNECVMCMLQTL